MLSLDTFYVGKLKGVGKVWQITGRDVASSFGRTRLIVGEVTAMAMLAFLREVVQPGYRRTGWRLTRVLTDKGKEFKGVFAAGCDRWQIRVTRTKPRHAWANGFVEPGRNVVNAAAHNGGQDYDSRVPLLLLGGAIRSGPLGRHNTCAQKQAIEQAISAAIQAVDCLINSC